MKKIFHFDTPPKSSPRGRTLCSFTLSLFLCITSYFDIFAQNPPKREFRAAWIATVNNIDFPSSKTLSAAQQQTEFINILNQHKQTGINAIVVQIRPTSDALYESSFEPWSEVLTGKQGQNPQYDPMKFMIEECRKRGIEFHAWFNPYRVVSDATIAKIDSSKHIAAKRPDLLLAYGNLRILNPGLQDSRNYVTKIVMDVVRRYDVDGVHFDDYFYPYPVSGTVLNDDATFAQNSRGFTNKNNWRRDNIDLLIKQVSDSIKAVKPYVKFGISPFGIWQNKTASQPEGSATNGLQSFSDIYADSKKWIQQGWVDYLAPQLYWYIGFSVADYGILANWWNNLVTEPRHIYIGQAMYRVNADANWNANEIPKQLNVNRSLKNVYGSIFYNTTSLNKNPLGVRDSLRNNYFKYPALLPPMPWKDNIAPQPPTGLIATVVADGVSLKWNFDKSITNELNKTKQFVVYRFKEDEKIDINNSKSIIYISPLAEETYIDKTAKDANYTYLVTALDRLHNESLPSNESKAILVTSQEPIFTSTFLHQNYPNPFEDRTTITYSLSKRSEVKLIISDLLGESKVLVDEIQDAGTHEILVDAANFKSNQYIYTLITSNQTISKRMLILK